MKDLKQFVGSKLINAKSMTLGEYNEFREWDMPKDEDPDALGYLLVIQRGDDSYTTWTPEDIFLNDYRSCEGGLPFSLILDEVKNHGARAARKGWNGKKMFIFMVPGSTFTVNREPLLSILGEGKEVKYHGHIDMKTADGMIVPWLASQTDLLADDWTFV